MYLYGDSYNLVNAWNAVNVPDKDGVLRHGSVIGVVDGGLLIDFHCPSQRSEFAQYGQIVHATAFPSAIKIELVGWSHTAKFTKNADVQVLFRLRPDSPWTWVPGKLVTLEPCFDDSTYAVVDMQLGGSVVTELIPYAQVRLSPSSNQMENAIVGRNDFVTRTCRLPNDYWTSISSILSGLFKRNLEVKFEAFPVSVFSEVLLYVQHHSRKPIQLEQLDDLFKCTKDEAVWYGNGRNCPECPYRKWTSRHFLTIASAKKLRDLHTPREALPRLRLPIELLIEVFLCLDTSSRIRCRRTCSLWNSILTSQHLGKDVRLSLTEKSFSLSPEYIWSPLCAITGCVLKCINSCTQSLSITSKRDTYTGLSILELIRRVLNGSRMERLILRNLTCRIGFDKSIEDAMDRFMKNCSCCCILMFHDTTLRFVVEYQGPKRIPMMSTNAPRSACDLDKFEVQIPFGSVELSAPDALVQLWDLVDRNCESCNRKRIGKWIKSKSSGSSAVIKILNAVQSQDPRETTQYRGRKWTAKGLAELDVSKLTRMTLHALDTLRTQPSPGAAARKSAPATGNLPPKF